MANGINAASEVAEFYRGKSVFVTGGTGFLGKVLIEKLLYSCDGIDKIYVLVREKKGVNHLERVREITNSPAFDRVKRLRPKCVDKIVPMVGNVSSERLQMTSEDLETLYQKVSVVFHVAATVNFNEPLKDAVAININGTEEILKICHKMEHLEALVHVSTAYCNTDQETMDEVVYPPPEEVELVRLMADKYSDDHYIVNKLLGKRPNTYTYTKALAEDIVVKHHGDIPTAIVRPSIVTSAFHEPCEGWVDNLNGPTGLMLAVSAGVLKCIYSPAGRSDIIPVDYVTNLLIVAATKCKRSSELQVYNCCTGSSNPITWKRGLKEVIRVTKEKRLNEFPMPTAFFTQNRFIHTLLTFILQTLPAWIIDFWSKIHGEKPRQMKIQDRLSKVMSILEFFLNNEWQFLDNNVRSLLGSISENDKKIFNFDVKNIDWTAYSEVYVLGSRKYLMPAKKNTS